MSAKNIRIAAAELLRLTKLEKLEWKNTHSHDTLRVKFGGITFVLFNTGNVLSLNAIGDSGNVIESLIATPFETEDYQLLGELYGLTVGGGPQNGERLTSAINSMLSIR